MPLIWRGFFGPFNNKNVRGSFEGFKLQAKLLLDGGEYARWRIRVGGAGFVGRVAEFEIVPPCQASLVDDGSVEKKLHPHGKISHGGTRIDLGEVHAIASGILVRLRFGIGGDGQLRAAFCNLDGIDGELALVAMELEPEAVGEKFLQHLLLLAEVGFAFGIALALNVVAIVEDPVRRIHDLTPVDRVGELHQAGDGLVADR